VHPTAEWVFRQVRRRVPGVSLATVYRNLRQLVQAGLVVERVGAGGSRFDGNLSEHHHFTCLTCRRVFDIAEPEGRARALRIAAGAGFEVSHHRVELYGRCAACTSPRKRRKSEWQARV
jgi:Fe2+ or Zn2+ uptake regulation protein